MFKHFTRTSKALLMGLFGLVPQWTMAHGMSHSNSGWHKLNIWSGEFHLLGVVFWIAIAVFIVSFIHKLIREGKKPPTQGHDD